MCGLLVDHLQMTMVILYHYVSAINTCVKTFKAKADRNALSLYIGISGLHVSKHFASKGYGLIVLDEGNAEAIFTGISLQDKGLGAIIIGQSGPEKHVANPGL